MQQHVASSDRISHGEIAVPRHVSRTRGRGACLLAAPLLIGWRKTCLRLRPLDRTRLFVDPRWNPLALRQQNALCLSRSVAFQKQAEQRRQENDPLARWVARCIKAAKGLRDCFPHALHCSRSWGVKAFCGCFRAL
ncbi:unnamed protein product [Merluccius merluccius]